MDRKPDGKSVKLVFLQGTIFQVTHRGGGGQHIEKTLKSGNFDPPGKFHKRKKGKLMKESRKKKKEKFP